MADTGCMNVVTVNDFAYVNGGASQVSITAALALAEAGVNVRLFAGIGPITPVLNGIQVKCLDRQPYNQSGRMLQSLTDSEVAREFTAFVSDLNPRDTVVHVHSNRDALSPSVVAAAAKMGFKIVYTCHDYSLGCPYGAFYNHRTLAPCGHHGLSVGCLTCHCNPNSYTRKLFAYGRQVVQARAGIPRDLDAVVFVSEFSRRVLQPYLRTGQTAALIRNPIDIVNDAKRKLTGDSPFLFVGTLSRGKDPVTAALAAKLAGAKIEFIGDGPEPHAVRQANPDAKVHGWLSREEVLEAYRGARALVFPSRWFETQGLVVQEAAACGVTAIVSDATAATEFIRDGETGLLFRSGSPDDLSDKMKTLLDDGVACEMGQNTYRHYWADPPTVEAHLQLLLQLYENVLGAQD